MLNRVKAGLTAGLAAGLAVAVMILVYDLVKLEPLATPRLLASNVLGAPVELSDGLGVLAWTAGVLKVSWSIILYAIAHFSIFAVVGVVAAFVFGSAVLSANIATGAAYGGLVGTAVFYAGLALMAPQFIAAPDWRLVVLMNAFAGVVLVSQLVDHPVGEETAAV
ncbi:MAG: hypothetical protein OEU54_03015 [Gemmatimonadota bacterium]|nr:hypothetical protein [Gemmatimonadota bacterium]